MVLALMVSLLASAPPDPAANALRSDDPPIKVSLNQDNYFQRGGKALEVRGRGDREAFYVDDGDGSGVVLAARSAAPFKFEEFVRGDHWDYRVLGTRDGDDQEQALLDIVQRMVPDGHFDYDAVLYTVAASDNYYSGYRHYYSPYGWR